MKPLVDTTPLAGINSWLGTYRHHAAGAKRCTNNTCSQPRLCLQYLAAKCVMCKAILYVICAERHLLHLRLLRCLSNFVPPDGAPKVSFSLHLLPSFDSKQMCRQSTRCIAYHGCIAFKWEFHTRGVDVDRDSSSKCVMDTSDVSSCTC